MTNEELTGIERVADGEDHPGDVWYIDTVHELVVEVRQLRDDLSKLQQFKDWVHTYLDGKGVPHHPPGVHGAEGCRIGDRMDWVFARIAELEAALKPFADYARRLPLDVSDAAACSLEVCRPTPSLGDCRRAAALLTPPANSEE